MSTVTKFKLTEEMFQDDNLGADVSHQFFKCIFKQLKNLDLTALVVRDNWDIQLGVQVICEFNGQTYSVIRSSQSHDDIREWNWKADANMVVHSILSQLQRDMFVKEEYMQTIHSELLEEYEKVIK